MTQRIWRSVFLVAALLGTRAAAQQIPRVETGTRVVTTQLIEGEILMRDAVGGRVLIHNRGMKVYRADNDLAPAITMQEQPAGFDLILTYKNTEAQRRPVGNLQLGVITLGPDITYGDFRNNSVDVPLNVQTVTSLGWNYPSDLYSPVAVLRNGDYAIGMSLHYPVLAYEHDAIISVASPRGAYMNGEGGQGWVVGFDVSGAPHGRPMQYPAMLEPGESRRYVFSVRVTKQPAQWVRTLKPYRDYFIWGYGGVKYTLDPNPVVALNPCDPTYQSPSNPGGWGTAERPDLYGWTRWMQKLNGPLSPWPGYMMWTPSGLYDQHRENNYPFQFTTRWRSSPKLMTAVDPGNFPSIKARGKRMGFWWGRSLQIATQWNPATMTPMDPSNPAHVEAATAELDLAVQAGANTIGLDSFGHEVMPIWKEVLWLKAMQDRAPGVKFIIEPSGCDVLHRLAANFIDGWNSEPNPPNIEALYKIKNADTLADFLLPGHETWVGMRWDHWRQFNQTPTPQRIAADIKKYARFGYVPVVFAEPAMSPDFRAVDTQPQTVPAELRTAPGAAAGVMALPSLGGGGGSSGGGGGATSHHGTPINPFQAARIFTRSQLRAAIRSAMGLP